MIAATVYIFWGYDWLNHIDFFVKLSMPKINMIMYGFKLKIDNLQEWSEISDIFCRSQGVSARIESKTADVGGGGGGGLSD